MNYLFLLLLLCMSNICIHIFTSYSFILKSKMSMNGHMEKYHDRLRTWDFMHHKDLLEHVEETCGSTFLSGL